MCKVYYCRNHEEMFRAKLMLVLIVLLVKTLEPFGMEILINKTMLNNKTFVLYGASIFVKLYNSVNGVHSKNLFYERLAKCVSDGKHFQLIECIHKQKKGTAVELDGIPMQAINNGGRKLFVHLCSLFNMFLKAGYLPRAFMQAVVVLIVKCTRKLCYRKDDRAMRAI